MSNTTTGYSTVINALERALVAPVFSTPQVISSNSVQVQFQDSDGGLPYDISQVQVLWRSNLPSGIDTNWQVFATRFTQTNGYAGFTDTNLLIQSNRFYRLLEH
jgi:hypothetical protein